MVLEVVAPTCSGRTGDCRYSEMKTIRIVLLLTLGAFATSLHAEYDASIFVGSATIIATDSPLRSVLGASLRFPVSDRWGIGMQLQFINDVTDENYKFDRTPAFCVVSCVPYEETSPITLQNVSLMAWYHARSELYYSLGLGRYSTFVSKTQKGWISDDYAVRAGDELPSGLSAQAGVGYMIFDPFVGHTKLVVEAVLFYQRGSGKMENAAAQRRSLDDFSGLALLMHWVI